MTVKVYARGNKGHPWVSGSAEFSECGTYRYLLTRTWGSGQLHLGRAEPKGWLQVIGLNCSTATEEVDDPTVRRCIGYAQRWGFAGLMVTNLFAFRATDPAVMKAAPDPVGPENDKTLLRAAQLARMVLAAWGTHGDHLHRAEAVRRALGAHRLVCLGTTKDGSPRHPLYVANAVTPEPYRAEEVAPRRA
jgi:hypothetical protein